MAEITGSGPAFLGSVQATDPKVSRVSWVSYPVPLDDAALVIVTVSATGGYPGVGGRITLNGGVVVGFRDAPDG